MVPLDRRGGVVLDVRGRQLARRRLQHQHTLRLVRGSRGLELNSVLALRIHQLRRLCRKVEQL